MAASERDASFNILFLNDSPLVRHGLAAGFEAVGSHIAFFRPHLWELSVDAQRAAVDSWLAREPAPALVIYEGLTGGDPISPSAIHRFQKVAGSRFYYWAIEDPLWSHEVVSPEGEPGPYALVADHVFTTAVECAERYSAAGIPSSVLRFACNPSFHRPLAASPEFVCDVVLVANNYPARGDAQLEAVVHATIDHCRQQGLSCRVHGRWWEGTRVEPVVAGPVPYTLLPQIYSSAQVVLGLEQCLNVSQTQSSVRIFEALGCGACYLGPRHRAHVAMFTDRQEALYTDSAQETRELLEWIISDVDGRQHLAEAGRARCLTEHTYDHRAREMLTH